MRSESPRQRGAEAPSGSTCDMPQIITY